MDEATFVIVGGGIAGVSCAEVLGLMCPQEKIILVTASPVIKLVSNIIPITKMLAKFDVTESSPDSLIERYPFLTVIQDSVTILSPVDKTIKTERGRVIKYKKLCLCSGGIPRLISSNSNYVIGIRDTESVQNFQDKIKTAKRIVVVGNGGIATEIVYELKNVEIIWVIKDNHISAPFIDAGAAEFFQEKLLKGKKDGSSEEKPLSKRRIYTISKDEAAKGSGASLGPDWHNNFDLRGSLHLTGNKVTVEYNSEIKNVELTKCTNAQLETENDEREWPVYVELTNNKQYGCDVIVSATGVTPNTNFKITDNIEFELAEDGGIKVDAAMETNVKDVYAAGDVCTPQWDYAPHWFQMRLWTQAHQMGCYAAKTMAASIKHEETVYQDFCFEMFTHVTNFFGFKVVLLGLFNGQKLDNDYYCLLRVTPGVEYIKVVMKDSRMQGAVLIGDTDIDEMCENLVLNQLNLEGIENDILNPDIDIDDYFD